MNFHRTFEDLAANQVEASTHSCFIWTLPASFFLASYRRGTGRSMQLPPEPRGHRAFSLSLLHTSNSSNSIQKALPSTPSKLDASIALPHIGYRIPGSRAIICSKKKTAELGQPLNGCNQRNRASSIFLMFLVFWQHSIQRVERKKKKK